MKILLTGAGGMVGRNILEHSKAQTYSILSPSSSELNLEDYGVTNTYVKMQQPDIIIHAAGLVGGIHANIANPVDFLVRNIDIGRNILMAAKENAVPKFINLASSCMYPRNAQNPLKEELILQGELEPTNEGYAIAKIFATRLCEYIVRENPEFQYKTIIPCNLYGRFDKFSPQHSHMVPAVIKKIHDAKNEGAAQIDIWGDGQSRREFMYAGDLADFIFYALDNFEKMPQNINAGLGYDLSINEYYRTIADVLGYKGKFAHDLSKPSGMRQKLIDNTKLRDFGWQPKTILTEGIQQTYEYFKANY